MKYVGLMFQDRLARAILAGRKSQTRRRITLPPWLAKMGPVMEHAWPDNLWGSTPGLHVPCSREETGDSIPRRMLAQKCHGFARVTGLPATKLSRACGCKKRWATVQRLRNPYGFVPPQRDGFVYPQDCSCVGAKHRAPCVFADGVQNAGGVPVTIWVREAWAPVDHMIGDVLDDPCSVAFRADLSARFFDGAKSTALDVFAWNWDLVKWRPSMFMPRWASRLFLPVVDVRAERLQDISEADAVAEGIEQRADGYWLGHGAMGYPSARGAFASLWDSINGSKPGKAWNDNPWTWAITFKNPVCRARDDGPAE